MRWHKAGIPLLIAFSLAYQAQAQVTGEVESVGFNGFYRPDCWTPMVVRLANSGSEPIAVQIQIHQKDLDGDVVVFSRIKSLSGNKTERYFVYFIPQAVKGKQGTRSLSSNLSELQDDLEVYACTATGKQIARLPITQAVTNVDLIRTAIQDHRGTRLILCVTNETSKTLGGGEYFYSIGMQENVQFVTLRASDLPEDPQGYQAIDGILWLSSPNDKGETERIRGEKLPAINDYIRNGGQLVVCQSASGAPEEIFGQLLPVTIPDNSIHSKPDLLPLSRIAKRENYIFEGPFLFARAVAKPGALVNEWIYWPVIGDQKPEENRSPYLVRWPIGLGMVSWVAQDLGDRSVTHELTTGWPLVWDRIFDWKNATLKITDSNPDLDKLPYRPYRPAGSVDLGTSLLNGMELTSKAAFYIFLAMIFFVGYWVVAGPGAYFWLRTRKGTHQSWFYFGAAAMAATLLTIVLVRLLVRGPPEMKHITLVRMAPDQPAVVYSRFGLYIPRDGQQKIELRDTAVQSCTYISPFAGHPAHQDTDLAFLARESYPLPLRELTSPDTASLVVPYRSTLKRLQARWVGELPGISGSAKLVDSGYIDGKLVNNSGQDLVNVYLAFRYKESDASSGSAWVLYIPQWAKGESLDLNTALNGEKANGIVQRVAYVGENNNVAPGQNRRVKGCIGNPGGEREWDHYWYSRLNSSSVMQESSFDDINRAFPMLSLFGCIPPMRNKPNEEMNRCELMRRGARMFDISPAISAGQMVILAQGEQDAPLPFPLLVEGDKIGGKGVTFYQFVIPLDRSELESK